MLTGFDTRAAALDAERVYIESHVL